MKSICTVALGICLLGWMVPATAHAAKADGPKAKFFAKYDKNKNGTIDADEKEALRKDFAATPDGDLKRFDKNKDGKLDDEEIAAIKPPAGKGKKKTETSGKTEKESKATGEKKAAEKTSSESSTAKPEKAPK